MSLPDILEYKFPGAEGIRTRALPDGTFIIFDWPAELGPEPTATEIATWTAEWDLVKGDILAQRELDSSAMRRLLADLFWDVYRVATTLNGGVNPSNIPELQTVTSRQEFNQALRDLYRAKGGGV